MPAEAADSLPCPHCGGAHAADKLRCTETDEIVPLAGRMLDRKFEFIELLGRGGMASVWLARNVNVDKDVAIKLIRPEVARSTENVKRFRAEARAAGRIGHRNICDIHDLGQSPIGPYIVMERLEGESLAELLRHHERLEPGRAVALMREALLGLSAAHNAGIVHRDLKPENLFLHRPAGGPALVKIMDFGVSKFTDGSAEAETGSGALLGTPEYMAPEQVQGAAHADARTDLWAVGLMLYRMLTGTNPFKGNTVAASLLMVSVEEAPDMRSLVPELPEALAAVVARCLEKDPDARFQNAAELDEALLPFDARPMAETISRPISVVETTGPTSQVPPDPEADVTAPSIPASPPAASDPGGGVRSLPVGFVGIGLVFVVGVVIWIMIQDRGSNETDVAAGAEMDGDALVSADLPKPEPEPAPEALMQTSGGEAPPPTEPVSVELGEGTGGTTGGTEGTGGDLTKPALVQRGSYVTPSEPPEPSNYKVALRACEGLAAIHHLGHSNWTLANPYITRKFEHHPDVEPGRYWTTANYKGRANVIRLPRGGKALKLKLSNKTARPMCVAELK